MTTPIVDINLITYNHEKFIAQAINSVLEQKTNFEFRLIIGDDCSTDKTQSIVKDYAQQYPARIKTVLLSEHLGLYHENRIGIQVLKSSTAKYIALLDGDDYWTSPYKLQMQINLLEKNQDCTICFHNAYNLSEDGTQRPYLECWGISPKSRFTLEDILFSNFLPTCSVVFRNRFIEKLPKEFYQVLAGDWFLHVMNAQHGDILYLDEIWGVRRQHKGGLVSGKSRMEILLANVEIIKTIDAYLKYKYTDKAQEKLDYLYQEIENLLELDHSFVNPQLSKDTIDLYLVRSNIVKALKEFLPSSRGVFLDIGCGEMPYKPLILGHRNSKVDRYIGLDIENAGYQQKSKPDLFWDGKHIPLDDCSVDCAVATEVLEHCPEPDKVLSEIHRVLNPDGLLFLTVPFIWPLHDVPYDEYRYTPFCLKRLLTNAGFEDIQIKALGGWDASLAQMIGLWIRRAPLDDHLRKECEGLLFPFYQRLIERDTKPKSFIESAMITGLTVTAKKTKVVKFTSAESKESDCQEEFLPQYVELKDDKRLAIFLPHIGAVSETFIKRHIQNLAPDKTVLVTGRIMDESWFNGPVLIIPYTEGPSKYQPDIETKIIEFLHQHKVTHILCEYGCYGTEIIELNSRLLHLPLFVHFHGGDASQLLRRAVMVQYYKWMGQHVSGVIAVSRPMKERLAGIGISPEKIHIVHYGIEVPSHPYVHLNGSPCRFLSVTRLVPKKAPILLLRAFAKALREVPDITLDIVGDGELRDKVEHFITSKNLGHAIKLHGAQPYEFVEKMMQHGSVYIQHSIVDPKTGDAEGLPNAILEASAANLPVISTIHEGIPEAVEHGKTGFLVPERDVKGMARYIIVLAQAPKLRDILGNAGFKKMQNEFNVKVTIGHLRNVMGFN